MTEEDAFDKICMEHPRTLDSDCEYYLRLNEMCSVGEGRCINQGNTSRCRMYNYYRKKIENVSPKPFVKRYPDWEEWRA